MTFRVELTGFTDGMVDRLKAMGLISEIISWKLRLFVPTGANGPVILGALMGTLPARPHRGSGGDTAVCGALFIGHMAQLQMA